MISCSRQNYKYDMKGQLLAVVDASGKAVEQYVYDPAGNILKKTIDGKATTYMYDKANQLVSSSADGVDTDFAYDAAGRLATETVGAADNNALRRTEYAYGWLDKVMSVSEKNNNAVSRTDFEYGIDNQLSSRTDATGKSESFLWDGLALIARGENNYLNEPAITGGNPILAFSKDSSKVLFDDMLGNTLGSLEGGKFSAIQRSAFGEKLSNSSTSELSNFSTNFFTGKPQVKGLGYAFMFRNYRSEQGKWQTADPMGYPDGWNNLAYGNNRVTSGVDPQGGSWSDSDFVAYYYRISGPDYINTDVMGLSGSIWGFIAGTVVPRIESQIDDLVSGLVKNSSATTGGSTTHYNTSRSYSFGSICYSLGDGSVFTYSSVTYVWDEYQQNGHKYRSYSWTTSTLVSYSDSFQDPLYGGIELGNPYGYGHDWSTSLIGSGTVLVE